MMLAIMFAANLVRSIPWDEHPSLPTQCNVRVPSSIQGGEHPLLPTYLVASVSYRIMQTIKTVGKNNRNQKMKTIKP